MKNWSCKKRWMVGIMSVVCLTVLVVVGGFFAIGRFNLFHAHEHCMKGTGLALMTYALDNEGKFPFHTNGFGDALLVLLRHDTNSDARLFTAPGDDGSLLKASMKSGANVPEERCTRAYFQGLSETNNHEIALIFDRYPTRGGDHFRRPWGPRLREVWMLGIDHRMIDERNWPKFKQRQIELLVTEGVPRGEAEKYYHLPEK